MKILKFLPIAAIACLAVSCQEGGGSGLSESSTPTDSLMYYLGQMNASDYIRESQRDTIMKEANEKQAYISGLRAGLAALKEGNDSYNKGVMLGINMASQVLSFCKAMDVDLNTSIFVNSLSNAIKADTMPNMNLVQNEFSKVMKNIEDAKTKKDEAASRESIKQIAEKAGLPKITDDLYGKATDKVEGDSIVDGTEVNLVSVLTKENGEALNIPLPPKGKIGNKRNFPDVVSEALETLKSGQTGEFMTTAHALLGGRAMQMNLEPTDVIKLKLTPTIAPAEEEQKADAAAPTTPAQAEKPAKKAKK